MGVQKGTKRRGMSVRRVDFSMREDSLSAKDISQVKAMDSCSAEKGMKRVIGRGSFGVWRLYPEEREW